MFYRLVFLVLLLVSVQHDLHAQEQVSAPGAVKGVLKDSVHNYLLPAATIAVYLQRDSSLISYQLSNNLGEFAYRNLPIGQPLVLVATFVGYNTLSRKFTIPSKSGTLNLGIIYMEEGDILLKEVVVMATPPVRMNGDTLEFNADAFKLDPNAVVEDLMRKLPGVTVWGDGKITVNGREVESVLVNGKPFFGGETKIATQNLPKYAVDKVQVYSKEKDQESLRDSLVEVNIKLKKGRERGYFGKIRGALGTQERYGSDIVLNTFSPRTQITLAGASNNENKDAGSVQTLLRNSTFKGVSIGTDYFPDFFQNGISKQHGGGISLEHDFLNHGKNITNKIGGDYFFSNPQKELTRITSTTTDLGDGAVRERDNNSRESTSSLNHRLNAHYDYSKQKSSFHINPSFITRRSDTRSVREGRVSSSAQGLQNVNSSNQLQENDFQQLALKAKYQYDNYKLDYSFEASDYKRQRKHESYFESLLSVGDNRYLRRKYLSNGNSQYHAIAYSINQLNQPLQTIFGNSRISMDLKGNLFVNQETEQRLVSNFDTLLQDYQPNRYLSNNSRYRSVNFLPALDFGRSFRKNLYGRYSKIWSVNISLAGQFYMQHNHSLKTLQQLRESYRYFLPTASISYRNQRFSRYDANYKLEFRTTYDFPSIEQLVPLVDSLNIWFIQKGNRELQPSRRQEIAFTHDYFKLDQANPFYYNLMIAGGVKRNAIVVNTAYDSLGRQLSYFDNADGHRYLNFGGKIGKALETDKYQWDFRMNIRGGLARQPGYLNNRLIYNHRLFGRAEINVIWSKSTTLVIGFKSITDFYRSRRGNGGNTRTFKNFNYSLGLNMAFKLAPDLTLNSYLMNRNSSSSSFPSNNIYIWNLSLAQRFLKGDNLEIKLSAMDILRQNKGILNYGDGYSTVSGTVNMLPQYYLLSVSYFPRWFGDKENKN